MVFEVDALDFDSLTTAEIKKYLASIDADEFIIEKIKNDRRSSVSKLAGGLLKKLADKKRLIAMAKYEREFFSQGIDVIAGIDEAGRGPLAGPVSVAAVILPPELYIPKLNDSKKLSPKLRDELYDFIKENAVEVQSVFVSEKIIDEINIYQATQQGMYEALSLFKTKPKGVLIDAVPLELDVPSLSIIKGDAKSVSIAAASVIAKVERDRYMDKMAQKYPMYGFERHKGYGTAEHIAALKKYGACELHRRTFEPVKSLLENQMTRGDC